MDVTQSEPETQKETTEEGDSKQADDSSPVEEYSAGVKKRIAKLTKRMREAERQREEAVSYARRVQGERDQLNRVATDLDKNYADEMEGRISSSLAAAQAKLAAALFEPHKPLHQILKRKPGRRKTSGLAKIMP